MPLTPGVWFAVKLAAFAPLLGIVMLLNYVVDPVNVFHAGAYEASVANVLLSGANVDRYRAGDERLLQKLYIMRMPAAHSVVALGSSRTLQVRSGHVPGRTFFNHALYGATIRDVVALYGLLRTSRRLPHTVLLGIDPWSFSPASEEGLVHSLAEEYAEAAAELGVAERFAQPRVPFAEVRELVSLRSFQAAVSEVVAERGVPKRATATPTELDEGTATIKRHDGSVAYDAGLRQRPVEAVRADAENFLRTSPYAAASFAAADAALVGVFKAWLAQLKRDGVEVIVWRAPLHPRVYESLAASPGRRQGIDSLESLCRGLVSENGVTIVGSFNPALSDLGEEDFYDGFHPKAEAVARLLAASRLTASPAGAQP